MSKIVYSAILSENGVRKYISTSDNNRIRVYLNNTSLDSDTSFNVAISPASLQDPTQSNWIQSNVKLDKPATLNPSSVVLENSLRVTSLEQDFVLGVDEAIWFSSDIGHITVNIVQL